MPDEDVRVSVAEERRGLLDAQPAADAPKKEAKEKEKASALSSWRRIWQEARDVRPALALGCVVLVLASAAFNGLPYLAGKLLDAVTADTSGVDAAAARRRLNSVALQLILLAVISGALSGIRMYIFNSASERVVAHIRGRLFRALLRQELNFFDVNVSGKSHAARAQRHVSVYRRDEAS
jgi:ABC-type multidrug transport system fused ATPase/permease subunit